MRTIDPDIAAALRTVFEARRGKHVGNIRAKHRKQLEEQIRTQIELLSDEVAEVIPKDHPAFPLILLLAVEGKVSKHFEEPEFKSVLGEGIPNGW
jgi:hypothetical protein